MQKLILFILLCPCITFAAEKDELTTPQSPINVCSAAFSQQQEQITVTKYFGSLFTTENWPARWHCGYWSETDGWVTIISDLLIFSAYLSIPFLLIVFLGKRKHVPFKKFLVLFSLFILFCGITHLIEVIIFWEPIYRFSGLMKLITGVVSWVTVIALAQTFPVALTFKKKEDFQTVVKEKSMLENQLEFFMKYTPGAIAMFDTDMKYIQASDQWYNDYGIKGKEIIGKTHYEVFPQILDMPEWLEIHQKALSGDIFRKDEDSMKNPDGSTAYIKYEIRPWYNDGNEIGGIIMFTEVITKYVEARKLLEASERKSRKLVDLSPDAIVIVNSKGQIEQVNKALISLLGFKSDELISQPIETLIPTRFHKDHKTHVEKYYQKPKVRPMGSDMDLFARTKGGSEIPVEIRLSPVPSHEGTAVIASIRDASLQRNKEHKMARLNEELEEQVDKKELKLKKVNKELEAFTYSVSHDLRAPLRAISGFSQALKEELPNISNESQLYLDRIIANTSKMGQLIDDLLNFSRMTRKKNEYSFFSSESLISSIISNNPEFENKNIKLVNLPEIYGDKSMLEVVFNNLISNAVKYSKNESNPSIVIQGFTEKKHIKITIEDNGVGFDMKYKHKLFGVFQRLHTQDEFSGTGIGLALCNKIMKAHHGSVDISSIKGKGTIVTIKIPIKNNGKSS